MSLSLQTAKLFCKLIGEGRSVYNYISNQYLLISEQRFLLA